MYETITLVSNQTFSNFTSWMNQPINTTLNSVTCGEVLILVFMLLFIWSACKKRGVNR